MLMPYIFSGSETGAITTTTPQVYVSVLFCSRLQKTESVWLAANGTNFVSGLLKIGQTIQILKRRTHTHIQTVRWCYKPNLLP